MAIRNTKLIVSLSASAGRWDRAWHEAQWPKNAASKIEGRIVLRSDGG
jgi:hypothetical protein